MEQEYECFSFFVAKYDDCVNSYVQHSIRMSVANARMLLQYLRKQDCESDYCILAVVEEV